MNVDVKRENKEENKKNLHVDDEKSSAIPLFGHSEKAPERERLWNDEEERWLGDEVLER